jgi:hypothetical protein
MFGKDLTPGLTLALVVALGLSACGSGSTASARDGSFVAKDSNDISVDSAGQEDTDQPDASSNGDPDTGIDRPASDSQVVSLDAEADAPLANRDADLEVPANLDAGDASTMAAQYSCTFNATGAYPLGGEHRGYVIFGTVIDTTAGAGRARVGDFQSALDSNDMIKFVWPHILATGHSYEIALFEDHAKNRTCVPGDANGVEAQWLFPVSAVTGNYTFNFTHNARVASCQDFPAGPISP